MQFKVYLSWRIVDDHYGKGELVYLLIIFGTEDEAAPRATRYSFGVLYVSDA